MSVRLISLKQFAEIVTTLKLNDEIRTFQFLSMRERVMHRCEIKAVSDEEIVGFAYRLYLANNMAWFYMYGEFAKDFITDEQKITEELCNANLYGYNDKEMLEALRDIRYNLYTNAGRCFLGQEDMERLDRLINYYKEQILQRVL